MGEHKKIGIVGGMGPLASVRLFERIVELTEASRDADHIRIFIDDNPDIPDRTAAILSGGVSPVSEVAGSIHILQNCGADFILLDCNTLHYFYDDLIRETGADIVNMIYETGKALAKDGVTKIGLLATTGTVEGKIYEKYLNPLGITVITPDKEGQEAVMRLIYEGVKAGVEDYDISDFMNAVKGLHEMGAQKIITGCTDISTALVKYDLNIEVTDALEILAETAVVKAGYSLKK